MSDDEQSQRPALPSEVVEALEAIDDHSSEHHKELSNRFLGLSNAVAFLSPAFLVSLETLLPTTEAQSPLAIQISWCAAYLSCVFGALHLWLEMLLPLHARNMAVRATKISPPLPPETAKRDAEQETGRFLFGGRLYYIHIASLLLMIVSAGYYRVSNF